MKHGLYPYVVFLPSAYKEKILSAIFGSKASIDILRFSLKQGISNKIYQKDLMRNLAYSNKTIIENLKTLTKLGVLMEEMEKVESKERTAWVKVYRLSDMGKWFALLLAEERELPNDEKAKIMQNVFRSYIGWIKNLSKDLNIEKNTLKRIFEEEMEK